MVWRCVSTATATRLGSEGLSWIFYDRPHYSFLASLWDPHTDRARKVWQLPKPSHSPPFSRFWPKTKTVWKAPTSNQQKPLMSVHLTQTKLRCVAYGASVTSLAYSRLLMFHIILTLFRTSSLQAPVNDPSDHSSHPFPLTLSLFTVYYCTRGAIQDVMLPTVSNLEALGHWPGCGIWRNGSESPLIRRDGSLFTPLDCSYTQD